MNRHITEPEQCDDREARIKKLASVEVLHVGLGERMERLTSALGAVNDTLEELAEKLSPVLGSERDSQPGLTMPEEDSELAHFLQQVTGAVMGIEDRVRRLTERVDL